jgi:hypothetical protein
VLVRVTLRRVPEPEQAEDRAGEADDCAGDQVEGRAGQAKWCAGKAEGRVGQVETIRHVILYVY